VHRDECQNVGGEVGYQQNFGGKEGIGSAGYIITGLTADLGNFNGLDLQSPTSLDGIEFGIVSATLGALNGGLTGQAQIRDTLVLTLTGVSGFTENQIGSVSFLYGTAPDDSIPGTPCTTCGGGGGGQGGEVPEPASLAALGTALVAFVGLAAVRRRRWI
jgi:hypothetical protein